MPWSITIARVGGTDVRIHVTFLLLLGWIWFAYYQRGGTEAAWQGVIFIALLFLCVLLHEFGHVFAARRYGLSTNGLRLAFVVSCVLPGPQFIAYLLLWVLIPSD